MGPTMRNFVAKVSSRPAYKSFVNRSNGTRLLYASIAVRAALQAELSTKPKHGHLYPSHPIGFSSNGWCELATTTCTFFCIFGVYGIAAVRSSYVQAQVGTSSCTLLAHILRALAVAPN